MSLAPTHQPLAREVQLAAEMLVEIAGNRVAQSPAHGKGDVRVAHIERFFVGRRRQADVLGELRTAPHLADGEDEDRECDEEAHVRAAAAEETDQ